MSKPAVANATVADPPDHPAAKAWQRLWADGSVPDRIDTLEFNRKSSIYRLAGVGPRGETVIAKRCVQATAAIEQLIYEEVLLQMRPAGLQYYGTVAGEDDGTRWLFLEDGGSLLCSPDIGEHRTLAAQWLGALHTIQLPTDVRDRLPNRGWDHYLWCLRSACDRITQSLTNPVLTAEDVVVLKDVVVQGEELALRWHRVEQVCVKAPRTLVHADYQSKNMRVLADGDETRLAVFDWEQGGCGTPAIDLRGAVDLMAYWRVVRYAWSDCHWHDIRTLAEVGRVLWLAAAVEWASHGLKHTWVAKSMRQLRRYRDELADALQVLE